MRRLAGAVLAAAVLVLALPGTSLAEPSAGTCGALDPRVTIPAGFGLDVCADGHLLTLVNRQSRPVLVRTSGDVGRPVTLRADGGVPAAMLRAAFPEGRVLMPGDSAQWSFGAGAGSFQLSADHAEPVAAALAPYLTGQQDAFPYVTVAASGALVRSAASAVEARAACLAVAPNFVGAAACDLGAATTIGRVLQVRFPVSVATELAGVLLDPARWSEWSSAADAADAALGGHQVLGIAVQPPSVPAPSDATRAGAPRTTATGPATHPAAPVTPRPATPPPAAPPTAPPTAPPASPPAPPTAPGHGGIGWPPQWPWPLPWPQPVPPPPGGGHDHDAGLDHGHEDPHGR